MELLCYPMLLFVPYKFCCQLHLLLLFSVAVALPQTILMFRRRISELTCQSNQHLHGQTAFFHYLPPTFGLSAKRLANRVITLRNHALLPRQCNCAGLLCWMHITQSDCHFYPFDCLLFSLSVQLKCNIFRQRLDKV